MTLRMESGKHRSLVAPLWWRNIPPFVVLCGQNGAGKSQLLDTINHAATFSRQIPTWKRQAPRHQPWPQQLINQLKGGDSATHGSAWLEMEQKAWPVVKITSWELTAAQPTHSHGVHEHRKQIASQLMGRVKQYMAHPNGQPIPDAWNDDPMYRLHQDLLVEVGPDYADLDQELLADRIPHRFMADFNPVPDRFVQELGRIFSSYTSRLAGVILKAQKAGRVATEEDKKLAGVDPHAVANELLEKAKFRYRITDPADVEPGMPYTPRAIDPTTKVVVNFSDLSSGEKAILTMVMAMYRGDHLAIFPGLLLLDEPDAHLHPSQIPPLLAALNDVIVKKHKCRVILASHRSETIAWAPPGSLFEMRREPERVSMSVAEWGGVMPVPSGVACVAEPVLSVRNKSDALRHVSGNLIAALPEKRCVFVEDEDDKAFYELAYSIAKQNEWVPNFPELIFLSPRVGKGKSEVQGGGCTVVKELTARLAGLDGMVMGLLDRDGLKAAGGNPNDALDGIHKIARYSHENYLLDPLLLYSLLLEQGKTSQLGTPVPHTIQNKHTIPTTTQAELQRVVDAIAAKVAPELANAATGSFTATLRHQDKSFTLDYPLWLQEHRGHDLQAAANRAFGGDMDIKRLRQEKARLGILPADLITTFNALLGDAG